MLNIPVTLTLGGTDVTVTDLIRKNDVGTYTFSVTVDTDLAGTNVIANILRPDNFKIVDTNVIQTSSSTFDYVLADNAMLYKGMLYIDFSIETIDTSITTPKIAIEIVKPVEAQTVITPADEAVLLGQFMTKQVYDADGNGIVDNSELLEGQDSAYYLARANHTGTQTASTIIDFDTEVSNNTDVVANTAKRSYPLADETKLAGIESGAEVNQTDAEIKIQYENNADTNAFTDAEKSKLLGIETGAEVNNISDVNATDLTDGGDSTLHYHATDRARANHTGTQLAATISDLQTTITNNATVSANNTELVNARTSDTYGAFGSVDARLEASDVILKDLADQLGVKSTLSTQLNETSPIVSVTDSYEGIASPTIHGGSLNQVVVNGSVESSLTSDDSTTLIGIKADGTILFNNAYSATEQIFNIVSGQKYFAKMLLLSNSVGRIKSEVILKYSDGTQDTSTGVIGKLDGYNIITATKTLSANLKFVESTAGLFTKALTILIPITGTPYENYTADQMNNLVREYFEGLKSVEKVDVVSRGVQYFNESTRSISFTLNNLTGELTASTTDDTSDYIRVKPSSTYYLSGKSASKYYALYDRNKNFISASLITSGTILTTSSTYYIKIAMLKTEVETVMFALSSTAIPYEAYDPSALSVDVSAQPLHKLPNLVENKLYMESGRWKYYKAVEEYLLQSGDISALSTTLINVDLVEFNNFRPDMIGYNTSDIQANKIGTSVSSPRLGRTVDDVSNVYIHYTTFSTFKISVPKGTYANLAEAQADLTGTKVLYQLATPIIIDEADFATNGISVEGILTSNLDYTNFYNDNFNIMPIVDIVYDANIASSVQGIKNAIENLKAFQASQNATNLLFDARITALEP